MSISVKIGSGDSDEMNGKKKKAVHKKPWFWLLLLLIASVAVKMNSRTQTKSLFLSSDEENAASTFLFKTNAEEFKIEDKKEDEIAKNETVLPSEANDQKQDNIKDVPVQNPKQAEKNEPEKSGFHFIINLSTKKYHTKECSAVKKLAEDKRMDTDIEADSLEEAEKIMKEQGFELCGLCDR